MCTPGHEGQAAEKDTDFQAGVYPLFFQVCEAAPGQQQRQQNGADEEKIHVGRHSLEQNGPTKPITSEETDQREKSQEPLGTDSTLPSAAGSLPASPLSPRRVCGRWWPEQGHGAMLQPARSPLRGKPWSPPPLYLPPLLAGHRLGPQGSD